MTDGKRQLVDRRDQLDSSLQSKIDAELISMVYQQGYTALRGVIATASGVAVIFYSQVDAWVVLSWLVSIYFLSFVRYLSIKKFNALDKEQIDAAEWGSSFAFFTFLSGLTWGAASIIFFTPHNVEIFNILTLIIIAMSVGSLAALSAYPKAFYLFVIPAMLPMIWRYLSIDQQYYIIFGVLLFVFNFALFSIARVNHRALRDSVILRFENVDLISQLTIQKEKAELANISKTKFLASASHDMRQPLHAMGLFLGVLEERVDDENRVIVQKIQKSSNALSSLLDSLLDISKLDAGVIQVQSEPFCIRRLFDALNNEFQEAAREKDLKIRFVDTDICIDSDYLLMERIMRNLISNAIRYTRSGGVLVVCRRYRGKYMLAVYDTGIGIDKDELSEIFREFHQLHNPERDRSKGLGLGLAIVERMAQLLDMPLHVRSVPGRGSVFAIVLRETSRGEQAAELISAEVMEEIYDGGMVLVVDDEEAVRDGLTVLLQNWQYEVLAAGSGDEAISLLQKMNRRPDIILADYRLREAETGSAVVEKVNSLYAAEAGEQKIPAIIITGDTAPERIKEAESSGYMILHKPVAPEALRRLLLGIL